MSESDAEQESPMERRDGLAADDVDEEGGGEGEKEEAERWTM